MTQWEWNSIGTSELRYMNANRLRKVYAPTFVIAKKTEPPIAVLVPYEQYLKMQELIKDLV